MYTIVIVLTCTLILVGIFLTILYVKHNQLKRRVNSRMSWEIIGPGQYDYGKNDPIRRMKEEQLETIRKILTLKWVWQWTTKKHRNKKRLAKSTLNMLNTSKERKRKARILNEKRLAK